MGGNYRISWLKDVIGTEKAIIAKSSFWRKCIVGRNEVAGSGYDAFRLYHGNDAAYTPGTYFPGIGGSFCLWRKKIIETYREHGVIVESLCFTGGIPTKNPWLVQAYTDVLGLPVTVLEDSVSATLGSAITAAVAAGTEMGGYATLADATAAMAAKRIKAYSPNPLRTVVYEQLYREYVRLHDYLGIGNESIMKQLRRIKEGTGRD